MATEQARAAVIDARADLFSPGSVLYAMATGVPPFRGATPLAVRTYDQYKGVNTIVFEGKRPHPK